MNLGVAYLLTNPQLAARLVVSIWSLRKWYDGPITVFTTRGESHEIGELLVQDSRLRVSHMRCAEVQSDRNSTFLTKITLHFESPYEATVFIDADTLVVGSIDRLLYAAQNWPLTVTSFCGWETTDAPIKERLESWRAIANREGDRFGLDALVDMAIAVPQLAINAGVLAIHRRNPALQFSHDLAMYGRDLQIPDEMALQLLLPKFEQCLLGSQFNCSPVGAPDMPDVRIWHFFAVTHLRHDQSREFWLPAYERCRDENVAQLQSWSRVERKELPGMESGVAPEESRDACQV